MYHTNRIKDKSHVTVSRFKNTISNIDDKNSENSAERSYCKVIQASSDKPLLKIMKFGKTESISHIIMNEKSV